MVVRSYMLYADQERPPAKEPQWRRDVRIRQGDQGTSQVVVTLSDAETEEFVPALRAFIDLRYRPRPVDESSAGIPTGRDPGGRRPRPTRSWT